MTIVSMLFQLSRAGLRIDGPSREGAFEILLTTLISFIFLLWYLYNKNSYVPLMIFSCLGIVLATFMRDETYIFPSMATNIINLVILYGLFYFDEMQLHTYNE